ncbi:MAG TPA: response regulator [Salinibacter sp.]|nr:response regulator [Salinibacter sp.]
MDDQPSIFPDVLWNRIREAERNAPADRPVVLIIEDDPNSQMLMRYALRDVVRTDAASTVADALRMAETVPYDGLLVDLRLPDGVGTEVVEELREESPYWGVPMVAVTAHSLPDESGPFLDAGFDAYVAKPFEQDELRTLVRHLVVEGDDAVDKGRKLVRKENGASTRTEKSARNESRREPPPTKQLDTDAMPDLS